MDFLSAIKEKAVTAGKHLLLPESGDARVLRAAREIVAQRISRVTLIGDARQVKEQAVNPGVDLTGIDILQPEEHPNYRHYADTLYQLRQAKGVTAPGPWRRSASRPRPPRDSLAVSPRS